MSVEQLRSQVPQGAKVLTRDDLLEMHLKAIKNWEPKSQVWPCTKGLAGLGCLAGITGAVTITSYRHRFHLRSYGLGAAMIPCIFIPTISSIIAHHGLVSQRFMTKELDCALCGQTRAASLQLLTGIVQPTVFSVIVGVTLANLKKSIFIPHPYHNFMDFVQFAKEHTTGPVRKYLSIMVGLNIAVSMYITDRESQVCEMVWDSLGIHSATQHQGTKQK